MKKMVYAPGCALLCYKPHLAEKLGKVIAELYGDVDLQQVCCFDRPALDEGTHIITPCSTCIRQYEQNYPQCTTEFFLKTLRQSESFPFPDYGGIRMTIQDTCAARTQPEHLETVRRLLGRMNIELVEPEKTGARAKCCGQVFYGKLPNEKVAALMRSRADEMPVEDVVVYCASCIMSMTVGGKKPRYLLDLLFGEPTAMADAAIEPWNGKLLAFRRMQKTK